MKHITLKIERKISVEDIKNLLDSAGRGANYWCSSALEYESETSKIFKGEDAKMYDHEGERNYVLNLPKVERGLKLMATKHAEFFADFVNGDYDMNTGDLFLQLCLFGKEKYS